VIQSLRDSVRQLDALLNDDIDIIIRRARFAARILQNHLGDADYPGNQQ
jgi:hypothetical protein